MTHSFFIAVVLLVAALFCLPASGHRLAVDVPPRITAKSVWNVTADTLSPIRRKCSEGDPAQHLACFIEAMKSAGAASDDAMAFVKEFAPDHGLAYVRAFRDTGRVDIAYIEYLYRANDLDGVLLVNGRPPMIEVDDYKFISEEDLRKNADYAALLQKYPNASVFPGDRYHTEKPKAATSDNGQTFQVEYLIQNGCHACARIGRLLMSFEFDSTGKSNHAAVAEVSIPPETDRPALARREPKTPENAKEGKLSTTEIRSKVGASFTITLPANHTTGYSWRLVKPVDIELLRQLSDTYTEDNAGRTGTAGKELWTFEALSKGTTDIEFEYARPWEKDVAPGNTAKYKMQIQ